MIRLREIMEKTKIGHRRWFPSRHYDINRPGQRGLNAEEKIQVERDIVQICLR